MSNFDRRASIKGHRKQHFVPVSYLKAWCDPEALKGQNPYVWIFDKEGANGRRKAPENIFHETDMYTIKMPDGSRDIVIEHGLQQLESEFANIRNRKLNKGRPLDQSEHLLLCAFIAAAHARTRAMREHQRAQWGGLRQMMERMIIWAETATEQQKADAISAMPLSHSEPGMDYEEVKSLCESPLQNLLVPIVQTLAPLLFRLDLTIFETDDRIGFITSDNPCLWFDSEAHKRPPLYRAPGLAYESIEITLPVSPRHCICLNRRGLHGYIKANALVVDELNKRTRFSAEEHFIVRSNETKPIWFKPTPEPDDSWDNSARKAASDSQL